MVYHTECIPRDAEHLFEDMSWAKGYLVVKPLEWAGEYLTVIPMMFTFRLAVCTSTEISEFWCYEDLDRAIVSWTQWPDIVEGWTRHHTIAGVSEYPEKSNDPASA
jgi:hypothetical protein